MWRKGLSWAPGNHAQDFVTKQALGILKSRHPLMARRFKKQPWQYCLLQPTPHFYSTTGINTDSRKLSAFRILWHSCRADAKPEEESDEEAGKSRREGWASAIFLGTLPSFRGRGAAVARVSPPTSQRRGCCLNATPQVGRAKMYFIGNMIGCHGDTSSVGVACQQDVKEPELFTSQGPRYFQC